MASEYNITPENKETTQEALPDYETQKLLKSLKNNIETGEEDELMIITNEIDRCNKLGLEFKKRLEELDNQEKYYKKQIKLHRIGKLEGRLEINNILNEKLVIVNRFNDNLEHFNALNKLYDLLTKTKE